MNRRLALIEFARRTLAEAPPGVLEALRRIATLERLQAEQAAQITELSRRNTEQAARISALEQMLAKTENARGGSLRAAIEQSGEVIAKKALQALARNGVHPLPTLRCVQMHLKALREKRKHELSLAAAANS